MKSIHAAFVVFISLYTSVQALEWKPTLTLRYLVELQNGKMVWVWENDFHKTYRVAIGTTEECWEADFEETLGTKKELTIQPVMQNGDIDPTQRFTLIENYHAGKLTNVTQPDGGDLLRRRPEASVLFHPAPNPTMVAAWGRSLADPNLSILVEQPFRASSGLRPFSIRFFEQGKVKKFELHRMHASANAVGSTYEYVGKIRGGSFVTVKIVFKGNRIEKISYRPNELHFGSDEVSFDLEDPKRFTSVEASTHLRTQLGLTPTRTIFHSLATTDAQGRSLGIRIQNPYEHNSAKETPERSSLWQRVKNLRTRFRGEY